MRTPTAASVNCNTPNNVPVAANVCQPWVSDCLFDLTHDPCETTNLADSPAHQLILQQLKDRIAYHNTTVVPTRIAPYDDTANPSRWNGWWVPWLDPVPVLQSPKCQDFNPTSALWRACIVFIIASEVILANRESVRKTEPWSHRLILTLLSLKSGWYTGMV